MARSADDPDRQAAQVALRERQVAAAKGLVRDLHAGSRVPSTVARVEYLVAEVAIILVAAGEDDRVCAIPLAPRDARDEGTVHPGLGELGPGRERTPFRITGDVSEDRSAMHTMMPSARMGIKCGVVPFSTGSVIPPRRSNAR